MNHDFFTHGTSTIFFFMLSLVFLMFIFLYLLAVKRSNHRYKKWPFYRTVCWVFGVMLAGVSTVAPLYKTPDFIEHMMYHLLLGMLSPLLMVLSAPLTLLFRTLKVNHARIVTRVLKSFPVTLYHHPLIASFLNIGGLCLLYLTDLYHLMHHHFLLFLLIHIHLFVAGYLFTASMIYIDPRAHPFSFSYRSVVLILALAGHAILSKWIYAYPPSGVSPYQAEVGGMMMYYGGDLIDAMIIFFLCLEKYQRFRSGFSEPDISKDVS